MRRLYRAACPAVLAPDDNPAHERARAIRHFEKEQKVKGFTFRLYSNGAVRAALSAMSDGKCAYCEAYYDATQPQDVEHYRPKGRIDTATGKLTPGYWWLASNWENLLPSCIKCNREEEHTLHDGSRLKTGKGDRFPIADEAARARKRSKEEGEVALLLDPSVEDPDDYLEFFEEDGDSIVRPRSTDQTSLEYKRARASINIYGLNRVGLVRARSAGLRRIRQSLALVEHFAETMDGMTPLQRDRAERLFLEEVALIRAHASGRDGFAAITAPLARETFERLGLRL